MLRSLSLLFGCAAFVFAVACNPSSVADDGVTQKVHALGQEDGGGSTPQEDGGGSTPQEDGGGSTPQEDGGGSTPQPDCGSLPLFDGGLPPQCQCWLDHGCCCVQKVSPSKVCCVGTRGRECCNGAKEAATLDSCHARCVAKGKC